MAKRPVFCAINKAPFYEVKDIEFVYYSGFATSQKQKSIASLHQAFMTDYGKNIIEISSKSTESIGYNLSAFNLLLNTPIGEIHIENVFQGGKVFMEGGPFTDLLKVSPKEAKTDERIKKGGQIKEFNYFGEIFPIEPKDYFYNWIYSCALYNRIEDYSAIFDYDAFTDIEFNPQKSINCQARTVAIFVGLKRAGLLDKAMECKESYLDIVYPDSTESNNRYKQLSLFD